MGWSIGFDSKHGGRDIGYGVPATCDHPGCGKEIDRGLAYICGSDLYGGEHGCGLFFCSEHLRFRSPRGGEGEVQNCKRCKTYREPFKPTPDTAEWVNWKLTDESWAEWRTENPDAVAKMQATPASDTTGRDEGEAEVNHTGQELREAVEHIGKLIDLAAELEGQLTQMTAVSEAEWAYVSPEITAAEAFLAALHTQRTKT